MQISSSTAMAGKRNHGTNESLNDKEKKKVSPAKASAAPPATPRTTHAASMSPFNVFSRLGPPNADEYDVIVTSSSSCSMSSPHRLGQIFAGGASQFCTTQNEAGAAAFSGYPPTFGGNPTLSQSMVESCSLIRNVGDVIVAVNGERTAGKSYQAVLDLLHNSSNNQSPYLILRFRDVVAYALPEGRIVTTSASGVANTEVQQGQLPGEKQRAQLRLDVVRLAEEINSKKCRLEKMKRKLLKLQKEDVRWMKQQMDKLKSEDVIASSQQKQTGTTAPSSANKETEEQGANAKSDEKDAADIGPSTKDAANEEESESDGDDKLFEWFKINLANTTSGDDSEESSEWNAEQTTTFGSSFDQGPKAGTSHPANDDGSPKFIFGSSSGGGETASSCGFSFDTTSASASVSSFAPKPSTQAAGSFHTPKKGQMTPDKAAGSFVPNSGQKVAAGSSSAKEQPAPVFGTSVDANSKGATGTADTKQQAAPIFGTSVDGKSQGAAGSVDTTQDGPSSNAETNASADSMPPSQLAVASSGQQTSPAAPYPPVSTKPPTLFQPTTARSHPTFSPATVAVVEQASAVVAAALGSAPTPSTSAASSAKKTEPSKAPVFGATSPPPQDTAKNAQQSGGSSASPGTPASKSEYPTVSPHLRFEQPTRRKIKAKKPLPPE